MKEEEIRPAKIFDEYLSLAKEDTKKFFATVESENINCPACGSKGSKAFVKNGFTYDSCVNCSSLFVNPRPVESAFLKYYTESESSKFWASTFYKVTADARRDKIWKPRAKLVYDILDCYGASKFSIIDIGGGFGIFAEEMQILTGTTPLVIEPGPDLADVCRKKSIPVIENFLENVTKEDLPHNSKAFVSFELFEHLHNPSSFLEQLKILMNPGDLFIFSTLSGTGLDIAVLWSDSKSVSPPHHLNFLNPYSIRLLLDRLGFEILEITTPGKLDINILENNQGLIKNHFWKNFIARASDLEKEKMQSAIAETNCSSHMMVVCRHKI
jgi:hypothetical protein